MYSTVGQMFILYTVRHFPPLVLSTITTTRKFFTILFSVFFMNNPMMPLQWFGVALVFAGLIFDKLPSKSAKPHTN